MFDFHFENIRLINMYGIVMIWYSPDDKIGVNVKRITRACEISFEGIYIESLAIIYIVFFFQHKVCKTS